jgi:DNA-binding transcriptional LysR family regulator
MDLGAVDLNTLNALRVLLEEGNLTQAGARVGMAQPAMSGVLGRYRRHFNDELLVRHGRTYELTPLAQDVLPHVQEAVRLLGATLRTTVDFDPATSNRLFTVSCSDYAMTVLLEPLRRRVTVDAPQVRLRFFDIGDNLIGQEQATLRHDVVVAPLGLGVIGEHRLVFGDRLVCLVDRNNPHVREGSLSLEDLRVMPHAVATFPAATITPADRVLGQLGIDRRVALRALGFLPLPFCVAGTDTVAIVPERLAARFLEDGRVQVVEPPFGRVEILEAAWWHPSRDAEAGHRWLLGLLDDVARELSVPLPPNEASSATMAGITPAAE